MPRRVAWLVDGWNVIGSRPDGWWRDREGAMRGLVERLGALAGEEGEQFTVVFDGRPRPVDAPPGVEVAFAPGRGRDAADHVIVERVRSSDSTRELRVVSSDRALGELARAAGAEVVSASVLLKRLDRLA